MGAVGDGDGDGEEDGEYLANQLGIYESISAVQAPSNGCRRLRGWTVFHLPSTRTVFQIPSSPGSVRTARQPGILDDKRRPGVRQEVRQLRPDSTKVLASRQHGGAPPAAHTSCTCARPRRQGPCSSSRRIPRQTSPSRARPSGGSFRSSMYRRDRRGCPLPRVRGRRLL